MDLDFSNTPGLRIVRDWAGHLKNHLFVSEALYFYLNTIAVTGFGALFWLAATRLYAPGMVGLTVVLVSVAQLVTTVAQFGLGYYVIRFLPGLGEQSKELINFVLTITILCAFLLGISVLVVGPLLSVPLKAFRFNPLLAVSFLLFTVTLTAVQISLPVLAALRAAKILLTMNVLTSLCRLFLLVFVFKGHGATGLLLSFSFPFLISSIVLVFFAFPHLIKDFYFKPNIYFHKWPQLASYSLSNFFSNLLHDLPYQVYPILVAQLVGLAAVAYFYVCWSIFALMTTLSSSVSLSLFVEGSYNQQTTKTITRRTLFFIAFLTAIAATFTSIFSPWILTIFGNDYRANGSALLRIIAFAAIPACIVYILASLFRVEKRIREVIVMYGLIAIVSLGLGGIALSHSGLLMSGWVWLLAQLLAAIYVICAARLSFRPPEGSISP